MDSICAPVAPDFSPSIGWWSGTIEELKNTSSDRIYEKLAARESESYRTNERSQKDSWREQIELLKANFISSPAHWRIVLEFPLVRIGIRIDTILITNQAIFVIEFKMLNSNFTEPARKQAEDYALDLRDYHAGSRNQPIIPVLVAKFGNPKRKQEEFFWRDVSNVFDARPDELGQLIESILLKIDYNDVDIQHWEQSPYRPIPNIIEAAKKLYEKHGVEDIKSYRADTINLSKTTQTILQAISDAKIDSKYIVVFVTGTPGAGKTLCGLNAVFSEDGDATFLTGTLPMVYVLNAALALDAEKHSGRKRDLSAREIKSKIQSVTGFIKHYFNIMPKEIPEHVIVFDEAQRAWDLQKGANSPFKLSDSEASIILDIMERHLDYAVIVGLIGNGQEINAGEAGLAEWGNALNKHPRWEIRAAPGVIDPNQEPRQRLFSQKPPHMIIDETLHLSESLRNLRPAAGLWVDAVLRGNANEAREIAQDGLPFFITRSLQDMRKMLRVKTRGYRRAGLICSSGAKRLVADGIWPDFEHTKKDKVANWFLRRWPDVRASDALEIPATEFACQGLELDYVGLCWGGDMTWTGKWDIRKFSGDRWNQTRKADAIDYQINTYRVLLTRARAETIIWVPEGDVADKTREPYLLDQTAAFLCRCGAQDLDIAQAELPQASQAQLL